MFFIFFFSVVIFIDNCFCVLLFEVDSKFSRNLRGHFPLLHIFSTSNIGNKVINNRSNTKRISSSQ